MSVKWLADVDGDAVSMVGGKAASLGELMRAGVRVPPGFVVTADAYRLFIESTGITEDLFAAIDVDPDDSTALATAEERAQELLLGTPMPSDLAETIRSSFDELDGAVAAVRSSATAEDLPDASFAGQQESYLNVTHDDLIDRVKRCWASLFTQRAIYYRTVSGFDHERVDMAVVIQCMVDADAAGVLFTSHPTRGDPVMIIEAAWGLGEAVVSGAVSPDHYEVDRQTGTIDARVAEQTVAYERAPERGTTIEVTVPEAKRGERVLDDGAVRRLVTIGEEIEAHFEAPQDVEWAIVDDEVAVLQSRPVTTIDDAAADDSTVGSTGSDAPAEATDGSGAIRESLSRQEEAGPLLSGLGASPGTASGRARLVDSCDGLDRVTEGDVLVTGMTTPDMVPAMSRAAAIVTEEGGMTSHASIVARELGVPAVVGTDRVTTAIRDDQVVTVDGELGTVTAGEPSHSREESAGGTDQEIPAGDARDEFAEGPVTATSVKVNVSIPAAAERAATMGADGVGLLRLEHLVLSTGKTPSRYIDDHDDTAYVDEVVSGIRTVADAFYPRPVRVRTLDAPTDEFRDLDGGDDEPHEPNPMLGYRGIRRSLDSPEIFGLELEAFRRLYELGYDNVEIMFPLVIDGTDVARAREAMADAGIDPDVRTWGAMVETPASALRVSELIDAGVDFVSFGTNDLTQYTLAVDRNNELVADRYDALHPAVLDLMGTVIETCNERGVETGICGQAGSIPEMVQFLVSAGVSSISATVDAVADVRRAVSRSERQLLLDHARSGDDGSIDFASLERAGRSSGSARDP